MEGFNIVIGRRAQMEDHAMSGDNPAEAGPLSLERVLQAKEERLRRLFNIQVAGVLVFDATGTLIDANDAFLRMTGYSREEVAARALTWRGMTPPEYVAESERQLGLLAATGQIGPYEKEYFCKSGSRSWMLFAGASLGDGILLEYCIDINDRKRAEAALRESEERFRLMVQTVQDTTQPEVASRTSPNRKLPRTMVSLSVIETPPHC